MVSERTEASSGGKVKYKLDIAKSIVARCCKRPSPKSRRTHLKKKRSSSSVIRHKADDIGYTVDVADLLFTPDRDFLLKNNGNKVRVDDLKGKTLLLFIVPIYEFCIMPGETLDIIQAYDELLPFGDIEFVFVPVYLGYLNDLSHLPMNQRPKGFASQESFYNHLFSTMLWPAVPFSDIEACGDRIVKTFSVDDETMSTFAIPFWVIIDRTSTVVATRSLFYDLFKLYGGAELHPLSHDRICDLYDEYGVGCGCESRKRLICNWDQLLASPPRDFLLSSNGDKVPISSLKDKVIGLYFCENIPRPPRMDVIKKVYEEAKLRGYDFEIVQINFHYICFAATHLRTEGVAVQQCYENISWLTVPFKDPSCRKLQRLLKCEPEDYSWKGDCLVIVDPRQADTNGVHFEFSGAEILQHYGIEGYPFTRETLFDLEYRIQKKVMKLQSLFPPDCLLSGPAGDSQLLGKRVLVFFAKQSDVKSSKFISMLEAKYLEQAEDVAEEDKFEVLYVSTDRSEASFTESIKGMPWLVHRHRMDIMFSLAVKVFKISTGIGAAAFNKHGELIAKEWGLGETWGEKEDQKMRFPFVSQDLRKWIGYEANRMCELDRYYDDDR